MFEALETMTTGDQQAEARELADIWRRISRQHLSSGQGCACGFGGGLMLQGAAFELDIVEFLIDDARKDGLSAIEAFIDAAAKRGPDSYDLARLIEALGRDESRLTDSERAFAMGRLGRTLRSIDSAHGRGRFACD